MGYTVTFYAVKAHELARRMRETPDELLAQVEAQFRQESPTEDAALRVLRARVARICRGDLPADCDADDYLALCWLAEVAAERFQICGFEGFRRLSFLDELAIWPELKRHPAPFLLPRSANDYPSVGYLSVEDAKAFVGETFHQLPPSTDRDVNNLREDFHYAVTTLVADNLDLLAVLL